MIASLRRINLTAIVLLWLLFPVVVMASREVYNSDLISAPSFTTEPSSKVVFSNSTGGRVLCSANGYPQLIVNWLLSDGSIVNEVQGLRHIQTDGTLVFPPFRAEDYRQDVHSTVYRCSITNSVGTLISNDVVVKGVVSQPYETYVYDVYTIKGNTAVMTCHIPQLLIDYVRVTSWIRDSVTEITTKQINSHSKYQMMPNGDLYIKDVDPNDGLSSFRCRVTDTLSGKQKISVTAGKLFITDPLGNVSPKITNGKKTILVKEGDSGFLPCVAQGNPSPKITWTKINQENSQTEEIGMDSRRKQISGSLLLRDIQKSDAGIYVCSAKNVAGTETTKTHLSVAVPVSAFLNPSQLTVNVGNPVTIKCKVSGQPINSITWYKDGKQISSEDIQFVNNETLYINSMKMVHKGIYQCLVNNDFDSAASSALLQLGDMSPEISRLFDEQILHPGSEVAIQCEASGIPIPKIAWSMDDIDILNNRRTTTEESIKENGNILSKLNIKNVRTEDGGLYSCTATNKVGKSKHSARINVYGKLSIRRRPKLIGTNSQEAILNCPFYGYPFGEIDWEKDGVTLPSNLHQTVFENGSLLIQKIQRSTESGTYKCIIEDETGDTVEGEVQLAVLIPPKIAPFSFQEELVREGMRGRLQCVVLEGDLPLSISWQKDNAHVPKDVSIRQIDDFSSILTIQSISPRHNGAYTCTASNAAATVQHTAQLAVNVAPKILPFTFQDDQFFKGMRAQVICAVSQGDSPLHFEWLKDGHLIPPSLGILTRNFDGHANSLSIESVSSLHTGNYTCIVSNEAATVSHTAQLLVYVSPKIIPFSFQDMNVVESVLARVSCVVYQGDLPITIEWLKDGHPLSTSSGIAVRVIDDYSSILTIESVQVKHTGNYTCVASNAADTITHSAQLVVNVPPKIVPFTLQDGNILDGMLIRVSCVVSRGDLPLTITWLKDSHPIPMELSVNVRDFDEYSSVLSIDPVRAEHSGNYTCIARNHAGTTSYTTSLLVQVPPKWIVEPEDVTARNGEDVFIDCKAAGLPIPVITWMRTEGKKGRRKLISGRRDMLVYPNGTLYIKQVSKSIEGYYFCEAENNVGRSISKSIFLSVTAPPEINLASEYITAKKGDNVTLSCSCLGNLPIDFRWKIGTSEINAEKDRRFHIKQMNFVGNTTSTSELTILWVDRKDSANIKCISTNEYGKDEAEFRLLIQDSPDPPVLESVADSGNRSAHLKWKVNFNGNTEISRYIIQFKKNNDNWQYKTLSKIVPGANLSTIVDDLLPATTYQFRILAENKIGNSTFSNEITATTDDDVPSGSPQNIEVESIDKHTLRITWKPPKKNFWNGAIRGYNIGYRIHGSNDAFAFTTLEVPEDYTEDLIYQLKDLKMYTQYGIIVQAYNTKGTGPSSEEILAMTSEDVPKSPPTDVRCSALSSKSIYVLWEPPAPESVNGILRGYKVLFKPAEEWYDVAQQPKVTETTKLTLQDLAVNTNYSIQVVAYTKVGDGKKSLPIFCKTHEDVPEAPSAIKVLPASADSVMVSWKPQSKSSGSITKYNIYYKPLEDKEEFDLDSLPSGDSSVWTKDASVHSSPADAQFFEIKGLKKNKKYAFWMTASSVIGEGSPTKMKAETVADSIVAAKAASFDDVITSAWKKDLVLSCRAVGLPAPQRKWQFGNKALEQNSRMTILSDGTLLLNRVSSEDTGNYTCSVYNEHGKDEIKYFVKVQVPPSAPNLDIISKQKTSIQLQWKAGPNGGDRIRGYNLHFRREVGTWKTLELSPDVNVYTLSDLSCGSTYQFYLEAFNSIGTGAPCDIITVSTEGNEITAPAKEDLIREGTSFITVNLDSWPTNGCPIDYFDVEYKQHSNKDWTVVSTDIKPSQKKLVIPGLSSATWYILRLTTHTSGRVTATEYKFATHTPNGGTIAPETMEELQPVYIFYLDPYIFIPAVALLIVVIIASAVVCVVMKRRNGSDGVPSVFYSDDGTNFNTWSRTLRPSSGTTFVHSDGYATINRKGSDPSPYASSGVIQFQPGPKGLCPTGAMPQNQFPAQMLATGNQRPLFPNFHCENLPERGMSGIQETTFVFPENINSPPNPNHGKGKAEDGYDPPPFGI